MGFLERAIRRGISEGVGKAVGEAITKAVEPTASQLANQAAQQIDEATQNTTRKTVNSTGLEGVFSNLERSVNNYATEMSKNIKICPSCGGNASANEKFCPSCGTQLPEQTVAEGAVCTNCGKQNNVGTKFCSDCGTKLPSAIQEEQLEQAKNEQVMAQWTQELPQYPKWSCGGERLVIEREGDYVWFSATFPNYTVAKNAVEQYKAILQQNGFRQAGQYPSPNSLYKMIDGVCYKADMENMFEGDSNSPTIYFGIGEPTGGFNYVKPEPKKPASFRDLFNF